MHKTTMLNMKAMLLAGFLASSIAFWAGLRKYVAVMDYPATRHLGRVA